MKNFDIIDYIPFVLKRMNIVILVFILFNFLPAYLLYKNITNKELLSSIEIAPLNEIELLYLREMESTINNTKMLTETSIYTNQLELGAISDKIKFPKFTYNSQNLLALFFDTAVSRNNIKNFIKVKNLENIIDVNKFNFTYNLSGRIDPFKDMPQKTVIANLKIPSIEYSNLLNEYIEFAKHETKNKVKNQLLNNIDFLTEGLKIFLDIIAFKQKDSLVLKSINLNDKLSIVNAQIDYTKSTIDKIISSIQDRETFMSKEEYFSSYIRGLKSSILKRDNEEKRNISDKIKLTKTYALMESILFGEDAKEVSDTQRLIYFNSFSNELMAEKIKVEKELEILDKKITSTDEVGEPTSRDEAYRMKILSIVNLLKAEEKKFYINLVLINSDYSDVKFEKEKFNYWYFIFTNAASLFFLTIFFIFIVELNQRKKDISNS